jgi:transketolase
MRALPGVVICAPGSAYETSVLLNELIARPGPAYLRLERSAPGFNDSEPPACEFGKARMLRDGADCTLIGAGGVMSEVIAAAELLSARGVSCRVLSMHTLKPFDHAAVAAAASQTGGIVTIEENSIYGGLGGAVAEVSLELEVRPRRFRRLGIRDKYTSVVGDQDYLRREVGIDRESIAKSVVELLG